MNTATELRHLLASRDPQNAETDDGICDLYMAIVDATELLGRAERALDDGDEDAARDLLREAGGMLLS